MVQTRHVNINSQHNGTQIERLQLVPSIHRHSNSMEPWGGGVKGKTFVPKENNGKYIIDIEIDIIMFIVIHVLFYLNYFKLLLNHVLINHSNSKNYFI